MSSHFLSEWSPNSLCETRPTTCSKEVAWCYDLDVLDQQVSPLWQRSADVRCAAKGSALLMWEVLVVCSCMFLLLRDFGKRTKGEKKRCVLTPRCYSATNAHEHRFDVVMQPSDQFAVAFDDLPRIKKRWSFFWRNEDYLYQTSRWEWSPKHWPVAFCRTAVSGADWIYRSEKPNRTGQNKHEGPKNHGMPIKHGVFSWFFCRQQEGPATSDFSWFPGFAWSMAHCVGLRFQHFEFLRFLRQLWIDQNCRNFALVFAFLSLSMNFIAVYWL